MEILLEDVVFTIISLLDLDDIKELRITNKYLGNICQIYMEKNYWWNLLKTYSNEKYLKIFNVGLHDKTFNATHILYSDNVRINPKLISTKLEMMRAPKCFKNGKKIQFMKNIKELHLTCFNEQINLQDCEKLEKITCRDFYIRPINLPDTVKSVAMYSYPNFILNNNIEKLTILRLSSTIKLPKFLKHLCFDTNDIMTEINTLNLESCYILNDTTHKFVNPEKYVNLKKVVASSECFLCDNTIRLPPNLERIEFTSVINYNFSNIDYLNNLKELRVICVEDLLLLKKLPNNLEILHINSIDPNIFGEQTMTLPVSTSFYKFTGNIVFTNAIYSFCKKYNIQKEIVIDFHKLAKENTLLIKIPNTNRLIKFDINFVNISNTVTHLDILEPEISLKFIPKNVKYLKFGLGFKQPIQNLLHNDLILLILPKLYPHTNFYLNRTEILYTDNPEYFRKPNCIKSFYE